MKLFVYVMMILLLSSLMNAAEIYGSVYDSSLSRVKDVVIEIDSSPMQRLVSLSGDYEFKVPPGRNYTIVVVSQKEVILRESVFIEEEGRFVLDLFILPDFSEEEDIFSEADEPVLEESLFGDSSLNQGFIWGLIF